MRIGYLHLPGDTGRNLWRLFNIKEVDDLCTIDAETLDSLKTSTFIKFDDVQDAMDHHGLLFNHPGLGADIETLEFSDGVNTLFHEHGIYLVGELRTKTEKDLQILGIEKDVREKLKQKLGELHVQFCPGNISIDELELSVRTYNCLKRAGITHIYDICHLTKDDLLSIRNFGSKPAAEIQEKMRQLGLSLNSKEKRLSSNEAVDILLNKIDELDKEISKTNEQMTSLKDQYDQLDRVLLGLENKKTGLRQQIKILLAVQNSDKPVDDILKFTEN